MKPYALTPRNIEIRDNFDAIARRYDLTNRVISLGLDLHWRRVAVRQLADLPERGLVLDLACGTCDMAREVLRQHPRTRVVGADLSGAMLGLARRKLSALGLLAGGGGARGGAVPEGAGREPDLDSVPEGRIALVNAPAEALLFHDGAFDAATIAFGIRNVPDYRAGLKEMLRVLRPGGRACVLEFSTPPSRLYWRLYQFYFFNILPRIGGLLTGREAAYRYLTESVVRFPGAEEFKSALQEVGFSRVSYLAMSGGIVCVHTGVRP